MTDIQDIPISRLVPHPDNPRLQLREDVIDQIASQISATGFFPPEHALLVRPFGESFQIVSGHTRKLAAEKASISEVPCWVKEMDDDEAFMQLVLSNAQGELSPLEIGMHALQVKGRSQGRSGQGLRSYASQTGYKEDSIQQWVRAAEVWDSLSDTCRKVELTGKTRYLYEISKAPEPAWSPLVTALLVKGWTVAETAKVIQRVKEFEIPEAESDWLPYGEVIARYLDKNEFAPATVQKILKAVQEVRDWIDEKSRYADADHEEFTAWLVANKNGDSWSAVKINQYLAALVARKNTVRDWHHGDWRDHVDSLEDGSVALLLTDPPYGQDYQSDRVKDIHRDQSRRHEHIAGDDDDPGELVMRMLIAFHAKLKKDAHVLVFCGWNNEPLVRAGILKAGFVIRGSLIWDKQMRGMGDRDTTFAPSHERILHAVKGSPVLYHRPPDLLSFPRVDASRHPTEKPVGLLTEIITATTAKNEIVADPFGGVASTLEAAEKAERLGWGCEISEDYWKLGESRIQELGE